MKSYAKGPAGSILQHSIGQAFRDTAKRFPDRPALISCHQGVNLTWSEYHAAALRAAAGLRALGLQPGDRVGIWAANCAEWAMLQFGTALAGIVLVNVNPAFRSHELSFVLRKSRMKALFLRECDARTNYKAILEDSRASHGEPQALNHVVYFDTPGWQDFQREPDGVICDAAPDCPAGIQYTSGTTGQPKGVVLTHRNIVNNAAFISQYMHLSHLDRICVPVPLFHCFGCVIGTMAAAIAGAAVIFPSSSFAAQAVLETIERERCTAIYGVPAMFIAELNHPAFSGYDLSSLRTGVMAGAPCPVEIMKRVADEMHCPEMLVCYGQTESSPVITMSRADDPVEIRCTTVGCPLPETEVRIVDPAGETTSVGEQGELLARGYMVMQGYDDEPAATRRAVDEQGWLHTGDLAVMRPDGYFRITGRARDLIIRGGENISPREIEEFLHTHPSVCDVQVVGVPDEKMGEAVAAWIRLKSGETADETSIRTWCRDRLAHFKVPQYVRFVDEFPTTLSGKVQKFRMREFEIAGRGLEKVASRETA